MARELDEKDAELEAAVTLPSQPTKDALYDSKARSSAIFTVVAAGVGLLSDGLQNNRTLKWHYSSKPN
jgi:hypothetical protein